MNVTEFHAQRRFVDTPSGRIACVEHGEGSPALFVHGVPVYVADTDEAAREEPRESIMHLLRYIGERLAASATASGAREIENRAARGQKNLTIDYSFAFCE